MPIQRDPGRRDRLAAAAAELVGARGYHAVGVDEIAAAAGISGPGVYRHFPDKEAILAHVLLHSVEELHTITTTALSGVDGVDGSGDGRVEALLAAVAAAAVDRRDMAALWRREGRHLSPEHRREMRRRSSATLDAWAGALLAARPSLAPADAQVLCWAALSVFGSVSTHHTTLVRPRFVELLAEVARRVLYATLPPAGTPAAPPAVTGPRPRREQLLGAAAELFHRYGFHQVTMHDIGTAVGIAGPSVYRHFPGKQAILCAIARRAAHRLDLDAEHALRAGTGERAALRRLVASYVRALTASPDLTVALSIDTAVLADSDRAELVRLQRDYVARWAGLLQVVQPELNPREAKVTVQAALTIGNDLSRSRRFASRPALPAELATLMAAALDTGPVDAP
jgi:AcrR family transcriptional regulator